MDSLITSSRTLPREIRVLWVNMSVVTSAKRRSIIFSPPPQKRLPWQMHFAIPQYPEIAEYSLYLLLKVPCQHMVLEPRCFITSRLLLSLEKVLWLISPARLTFSSELLCIVLCFEKTNRGKNSALALVLWFHESEIYSPVSLLEDWLKKTSLWTLFQTRGGCNNCNLLLYVSWCEGGRTPFTFLSREKWGMEVACIQTAEATDPLCTSSNYIRPCCGAYWDLKLAHIALCASSLVKGERQNWPHSYIVGWWSTNSIFQVQWILILWYSHPTVFAADVRTPKWQLVGLSMQFIVCGQ